MFWTWMSAVRCNLPFSATIICLNQFFLLWPYSFSCVGFVCVGSCSDNSEDGSGDKYISFAWFHPATFTSFVRSHIQQTRNTAIKDFLFKSQIPTVFCFDEQNLEFHGVMRFYFEDHVGGNVATKCLRVCSSSPTHELIETLSEKFRPDMKMLTTSYSLYEIHGNKGTQETPGEKGHVDSEPGFFFFQTIKWLINKVALQ